MTDYEQVYDEAWSGVVGRDRNELHAAGIAAVVAAAKTDALDEAAQAVSAVSASFRADGIGNAGMSIEAQVAIRTLAATYRTPGGTDNG